MRRKLGISTPEPSHPSTPTVKETSEQQLAPEREVEDKEGVEPSESTEGGAEQPPEGPEQPSTSEQLPSSEEPKGDQSKKLRDETKEGEQPASTDEPKGDEEAEPPLSDESKVDEEDQLRTDGLKTGTGDELPSTDGSKAEQLEESDGHEQESDKAPTEEARKEESEPVPAETLKADSSEAGIYATLYSHLTNNVILLYDMLCSCRRV